MPAPDPDQVTKGDDKPATAAQRRYLDMFMAWLRDPSEENLERRRKALDLVCMEAGVVPSRAAEMSGRLRTLADGFDKLAADLRGVVASAERNARHRQAKARRTHTERVRAT